MSLNIGRIIGRGMVAGITGALGAMLKGMLAVGKMSLMALVIGTVATAIAGLIGAIIQLLPYLAELVTTAISAAGALLLIPGAIATLVSVIATLKLGLQGVGDAIKAGLTGDVEKFNEALEKLAPNAADFVREIVRLKPAWDRMRMPIQNALFAELAVLLRQIAERYLPLLETSLTRIAEILNGAFRVGMGFLLEPGTSADIGMILASAATAAANFVTALRPMLQILRDVVVVSTDMFAQLSGGLLPLLQGWADTIAQMRADGSLAQLILDGLEALKLFGALAGDILGILRGIFSAAGGAEGGGIFAFFDRLNQLVNSVTGQETLTELFTALGNVAVALAPVLLVLAQALVPIAEGLEQVAVAFSPGLQEIALALSEGLVALVPAFLALSAVLPALAPLFSILGTALSDFVVALAPHLVTVLDGLALAFEAIAPHAGPLGEAIGKLFAILAPFLPVLAGALAEMLVALAPGAMALLDALVQALMALAPHMPALAVAVSDLVVALAPLIAALGPALAPIITVLAEELVLFAEAIRPITPLIASLIVAGAPLLEWLFRIGFWFAFLPIKVMELGRMIFEWLTPKVIEVKEAIRAFADTVAARISQVMGFFTNLKTTVMNALGNAGSLLYNAGRDIIQGLINGVTSMISSLKSKMSSVASTIRNFFPFSPAKTGPLSGRGDLRFAGQNMVTGLVTGIEQQMSDARAAAAMLAGVFSGPALAAQLVGVPGAAGVGGGPAAGGDTYVMVQIGERPVTDMVKGVIVENPTTVADATNEGNRRQAGFGRKKVGDV